MNRNEYLQAFRSWIPSDIDERDGMLQELEALILDREAAGEPFDMIAAELGDPVELAASWLEGMPMEPASTVVRAVAKAVDYLVVGVPITLAFWLSFSPDAVTWIDLTWPLVIFFGVGGVLMVFQPLLAEWLWGRSVGKAMTGLRVVRENGTRITFTMSLLRQLPFYAQIFWIDIVFMLFGEYRQRGFERLSHTRTIVSRQS